MSLLNDRERAFENLFSHQEKAKFMTAANIIRGIAAWSADEMGLTPLEADSHFDNLMTTYTAHGRMKDVHEQVKAAIELKGLDFDSLEFARLIRLLDGVKNEIHEKEIH